MIQRRSFLLGLASSLTAPAIVHAGNLMPIKPIMVRGIYWSDSLSELGSISTVDYSLKPLEHFLKYIKIHDIEEFNRFRWHILY